MAIFTVTEAAKNDLKNIARFTQKRWGLEQQILDPESTFQPAL